MAPTPSGAARRIVEVSMDPSDKRRAMPATDTPPRDDEHPLDGPHPTDLT